MLGKQRVTDLSCPLAHERRTVSISNENKATELETKSPLRLFS